MVTTQRGSILVVSYLFIAFLIAWQASGFQRSAVEINAAERYVDTTQAFHYAEAGLSDAMRWLQSQPTPPAGTLAFDPFGGTRAVPGGTYTVTIDPDDNNPTSYLDLYTVTATGLVNGVAVSRQVAQWLRTESFARYSYFTNSERLPNGTRIWFTSRDRLQGPVHSNDQFNIAGSPIFDGAVTSVAASVNYKNPPPTGGNNPQFNGGLALNAPSVVLPLSVTQLRVAASSGGQWYQGNTTITLQSNGTLRVTNAAAGLVNQPIPLPVNGAVFVNGGNAIVSGTLDGSLSIGSSDDIIIANNIRYADDPQVNPASNDMLGLVAEENVLVSASAPYDVTIHASIMALDNPNTATALDGSFTVENWWVGPPKGTLTVYGGIIQGARGPVGTFSGSSGAKLSGFSKDYRYDTRLASTAPPFYPTTGNYEDVLWQEN